MTRLESLHCFHIIYHSDNITNPKGVELQEKESHKLLGDEARKTNITAPPRHPHPQETQPDKKPLGITKHRYSYQEICNHCAAK